MRRVHYTIIQLDCFVVAVDVSLPFKNLDIPDIGLRLHSITGSKMLQ